MASKISPTIPGLEIVEVHSPEGKAILVIAIPRSESAPHQGPKNTYYRRHQCHSQPIAHFEIEDLRLRQVAVEPLVTVSTATRGSTLTAVDVRNTGRSPAEDVTFEFSPLSLWANNKPPDTLTKGIRHLGPGQQLRFRARPFNELFAEAAPPAIFEVTVRYTHARLRRQMSDRWCLDFEAYRGSMSVLTDEQQLQQDAVKEIRSIGEYLAKLTRSFEELAIKLAGGNGLDLSLYTLRNLQAIVRGASIEKLSPLHWTSSDLAATLGIGIELASRLEGAIRMEIPSKRALAEIDGMTPEILARLEASFELQDEH